ncbi:MAG: hypothetical protein J5548_10920 [Prevotella sp.]|nr:hypothetical protein [Prevotella sp.]
MKHSLMLLAVLCSVLFTFTSCLDDDSDEIVYPSDAAISAFSLGTLNRYVTTKSSTGNDSTIKSTVTGSSYRFYIDQVNRTIYNPDSLPYGTDVKHVVCTIGSKNSAQVLLKSTISDSLFYYNSSDSLDFSVPRELVVYSLNGENVVRYSVNVNVHKEEADSFLWHNTTNQQDFAEATGMKAISLGNHVYLFCSNGRTGNIYSTDINDGTNWEALPWDGNVMAQPDIHENVVPMGGYLYLYSHSTIWRTDDCITWEPTGSGELHRLVAASSTKLYALDEGDNLISSSDEGATWVSEQLDTNASLLPTTDLSFCCFSSRVDKDTEIITLVGNRSESIFPDDVQAHVWSKLADFSQFSTHDPWMYVNPDDVASRMLPRLASLNIVNYDNGILAAGASGRGACQEKGFQRFYFSNDGGIYWNKSESCSFPAGFECGDVFTMTVDANNFLWLVCGESGQVWKGRMSANSGEKRPTAFTE